MIDRHLNRLRLAGYRPETIRTKKRLFQHLQYELGDKPVHLATRDDLETYLCRDLSPASRKAYRSHFRAYYAWLVEEGIRADNPAEKLPSIRVPRGLPRPVRGEDLQRAISLAPRRMKAWLLLMSLAGLRCMEVATLRPSDLQQTSTGGWVLYLREMKGGGVGAVPASELLVEYLQSLPVRNGLWWSVSASQVSLTTNAYLRSVGVDATAHQFRHWAGTAWYEASGHDLLTTAQLLRHVNVATTQTYAQVDPARPALVAGLVRLPSAS